VRGSGADKGSALGRSCSYPSWSRDELPLHARAYTLRAFELRTGDLVDECRAGHLQRWVVGHQALDGGDVRLLDSGQVPVEHAARALVGGFG
jgi:hypothetical protein